MRPVIPPPLDPDDFEIEVVDCTGAAPRVRPSPVEDVADVVFEDWDGLRAPMFGGKAVTA